MNKQTLLKELNSEKIVLDNEKPKISDKKIIVNKKNENKKKVLSIIVAFILAPFAVNLGVFLADKTYAEIEKNMKKNEEIELIVKDIEKISMTAQEMVMNQLKPINKKELNKINKVSEKEKLK